MVDAVINTLFLQRQHRVMRDMELAAAASDRERELSAGAVCSRDLSPTPTKQIKR